MLAKTPDPDDSKDQRGEDDALAGLGVGSFGATLAGPLFQGGQLRAQYRAAKASFDEAKAEYEQTVLTALREVSDALDYASARFRDGRVTRFETVAEYEAPSW